MLTRLKYLFKKRPFVMNLVSYGNMFILADLSQQAILLQTEEKDSMDYANTARFATIGFVGMGPFLFGYYKIVDNILPGSHKKVVVAKVVLDLLIVSSASTAIFFTGMGILERRDDIFEELRAKFWSTYKLSCCFWLPAQTINFAFLPSYTRVAFVGAASFVWVNILCFVKRQQFAPDLIGETEVATDDSGVLEKGDEKKQVSQT